MKISPLLILCTAVLLAGCDSMSSGGSLPDRFSTVPPKIQTFAAPVKQVIAAAQVAFKRLDFNVTHARVGDIEAVSRIDSSEAFADSRQLVARVHIEETDSGQAEVELALLEEVQSQSMGDSHVQALKEHSFFSMYFATLQQVLHEQAEQGGMQKP